MGGDHAPRAVLEGALAACREDRLRILLVGPARRLRREIGRFRALPDSLEIVDADDVVGMDDPPVSVLRSKRRSTVAVCAELVRTGRASAMVTAGNTGAAWVAARSTLGMIPGVDRPALAAILPKLEGRTLLLDVGANVECKPQQFVQFAVMGSQFAEAVMKVRNPSVGLLSVGEEHGKGGARVREPFRVLSEAGVRFVGNVEGRDVFGGDVDVIVCDGFTGNAVLKAAEGLGEMVISVLMDEASRSPVYGTGLLMAKGAFRSLRQRVDYAEVGGAPLLGVDGACLIGHGRSSARAIRNALGFAADFAASNLTQRIEETLRALLHLQDDKGET
jgi:glycerol-3-phosphate acyltransferase PlsX